MTSAHRLMARGLSDWPHLLCSGRCGLLERRRRRTRSLISLHTRLSEVATPKHIAGAPELVIEIGSPSTRKRDETIKKRLYERWGVSEYWVVDPETDVVRVYRRDWAGFGGVTELSRESGDVLTTPLLSGLELPLSRIFRE
jgi:Uma2 family endonuclease